MEKLILSFLSRKLKFKKLLKYLKVKLPVRYPVSYGEWKIIWKYLKFKNTMKSVRKTKRRKQIFICSHWRTHLNFFRIPECFYSFSFFFVAYLFNVVSHARSNLLDMHWRLWSIWTYLKRKDKKAITFWKLSSKVFSTS